MLGGVLVGGFVLFATLLMIVRHIVLPQVPAHRDDIAALIAKRVGAPVTIASLATGWDGWNPKLVIDGLRVALHDRPGGTLLDLPHVELVASWTSLPLLRLQLRTLLIERPQLAIVRDKQGRFHVAGLEIDPDAQGENGGVTDWLLRQREIVVRDALIQWTDERRDAPQLVLDRVQFRLENNLLHHRFGLTGEPPPELASPLDLRGDVSGLALDDWQKARGNLYLRLDYADVAAWSEWVPLPVQMRSGKGAVRAWLAFDKGIARSMTSDVELADVSLQVQPGLAPLALAHLGGRVEWRDDGHTRTIAGRHVTFTTAAGASQLPVDVEWTLERTPDGTPQHGRFTFTRLELAPLAAVATQWPLPESWRATLSGREPRGALTAGDLQWEGGLAAPTRWSARASLVDVGVRADATWPGVTNLSGSVDAASTGGTLKLASKGFVVDAPRVLRNPLTLDRIEGTVAWQPTAEGMRVELRNVALASADLATTLTGQWHALPSGPGAVDIKAQIPRANLTRITQALSAHVPSVPLAHWLRTAFPAGTLADGHVAVVGDLAEFPFAAPSKGTFTGEGKITGATFVPYDGWPTFSAVDGVARIDRAHVTVEVAHATAFDARIDHALVDLPDLTRATVSIKAEASGPAASFLQFVAQSPIAGWVDHYTDDARATGDGHLAIDVVLPFASDDPARVSGEYRFGGGALNLPGAPALTAVSGPLRFDEHGLRNGDITATVFGGPTRIGVASVDGGVRINASGVASLAALRTTYPVPLIDRVAGTTDWQFSGDIRAEGASWTLDAPLRGATIDLPAPLHKAADSVLPARVERRGIPGRTDRDTLTITVGNAARVVLARRLPATGPAVIERGLALVGTATERPGDASRDGIWIRAALPDVDLDDWMDVRAAESSAQAAAPDANDALRLMGIDLVAGHAVAMGRAFRDVTLAARAKDDGWQMTLQGPDAEGTAQWLAATPALPNGKLVARLVRLAVPRAADVVPASAAVAPAPDKVDHWPEVDIDATHFLSHDRDLGSLALRAQPSGNDWRIDRLDIASDAGKLAVTGRWRIEAKGQHTDARVHLDARDGGAFLVRFGYPEAIRGAPTTIDGDLTWAGAPSDFDYPTLNGTLALKSGAGQFTKVDPGLGKLLGVLSLQALPRRIALDFRDVFSEGFAFDEARGNVRIADGVLHTDDFAIVGPAARVTISGQADIAAETQTLNVRVQPSLATSFSAGTAGAAMLLLAATPVVAAAVGAGTLLAQKVLKDPIETLFSYDYRVTGSWTDPVVVRVERGKTAPTSAPAAAAAGAANGSGVAPAPN
ncbi:MAG: TIGR02099 family protein [Proteobacteria bacterium]|nr:TIGR02099 family protein [Pseudomonadota bacterium]